LISEETKEQFLAERKRVARLTIPELIARLESGRFAVRFAAEMRLRELAGL
jgi:hypothetical protein